MTGYAGFFHHIPTMKTIGKTFDDEKYMNDEVVEAVEKAKDAFEGAAKAGAAAAATIGAELASRISEKLEQLGAIDFFPRSRSNRSLRRWSTLIHSASQTSVQ